MKKINLLLVILFLTTVAHTQNVGIGTVTPAAKLEVHHRSSTAIGLKLVDSSANTAGTLQFQNLNFTKGMRAEGFSASNFNNGQYLDVRSDSTIGVTFKGNGFTGIRKLDPVYPLDVNGDINTSGRLRLNGNAGNTGQVLVSNGAVAAPSWQNTALSNSTRFAVTFTHLTGSMIADAVFNNTYYNLNTADVVIGTNLITINRSGLYHFDINASPFISFSSFTSVPTFNLDFYTGANGYQLMQNKLMTSNSPSNIGWRLGDSYSIECYIQAPATLRLAYSFGFTTPVTYFMTGYMTGHLIAE